MKIAVSPHLKKFPFFYGYLIIFAGAIGAIMSAPGQTIGVSAFTDHLLDAFKLSRVELSWTYLIGTITSATLLTFGGRMYDKYGARAMATIAAIGLACFLLLLSRVDVFSKFIGTNTFIPFNISVLILLTIGFLGIRFFGQGMLTMVSRNMVMKWFDKKRGLASAFFGVALVLGFSLAPKSFSSLITNYDWRAAWVITALIVGIGFSLFALILFRDNPEDLGMKPDGNLADKETLKSNKKKKIIATGANFELKSAITTYSFWVFALAMTLFALYITAFTFHIEDIFVSAGLTRADAISTFIPTAFIAVGIQLVSGYVADYVKLKYILFVLLAGLVISMFATLVLSAGLVFWMVIIGNSLSQGVFGVLSSIVWPRFFGIKHLGAISGFASSLGVAGSAVGPLLFSYSKSFTGSYFSAITFCVLLGIVLIVLAFKADNASENIGENEAEVLIEI